MKKILSFCFFALALFLLTSCAPKPNMEQLLSYQVPGTEISLCIKDGEIFRGKLKMGENDVVFTFTDEKREGISYRMDKSGKLWMFFEDVEIPLDPSDELKCKDWLSLFCIPSGDNIWKIRRETVGGIAVYVCRDEKITIYIDATSGFPLKIESDGIAIDILDVKTN